MPDGLVEDEINRLLVIDRLRIGRWTITNDKRGRGIAFAPAIETSGQGKRQKGKPDELSHMGTRIPAENDSLFNTLLVQSRDY